MSYPNHPDKIGGDVLFTAADALAMRRRKGTAPTFAPPQGIILCYQSALIRHVTGRYRAQKTKTFFGDLLLLKPTGGRVGVASQFGVGAPVVAALVEDYAAYGVRQFISVGLAGGLQETLNPGDVVIADRAIRDEGTSYHYLPPEKYISASAGLAGRLRAALESKGIIPRIGPAWTTDAPYRETRQEAQAHLAEGVQVVDMEAAALFAVGQALGVEVCAAFAVGDSIRAGRWQLDFEMEQAMRGLRALLDAAVEALA